MASSGHGESMDDPVSQADGFSHVGILDQVLKALPHGRRERKGPAKEVESM